MDYALCPIRYVLGYVVSRYPSFTGEFQQSYARYGLNLAISDLCAGRIPAEEVCRQVDALFPAMRNSEKRQARDYLKSGKAGRSGSLSGLTEYEGRQYTEERLNIAFPNRRLREQALHLYASLLTPDGRNGMDLFHTPAAAGGDPREPAVSPCLYCPQQSCCKYAEFAADEEALYEE